MTNNMNNRIIVPLDVSSTEEAIALLDTLPDVNFWKVGLEVQEVTFSKFLKTGKNASF
jgi:orotidine-5'-phosphate decarboxylase